MKKIFLKKIKQLLLEEKAKLNEKYSNNNKVNSTDIDIDGDEIDIIQGNILAHTQNQISMREQIKLKNIDAALLKLKEGNFGICEECEELIAEARLLINPTFNICIGCAEQAEMEEKQRKR